MGGMESIDFTSVPLVGELMSQTGISDGWLIVAALILLLAAIFLIGWLRSASKGRKARRELAQVRQELVGAQALVNLPPLHEGDYDFVHGDDPGSSLVFASARELRHRQEQAPLAPHDPFAPSTQPATSPQLADEPAACEPATSPGPSVTAQVHEAILASVAGTHLQQSSSAGEEHAAQQGMVGNRPRKANGAAITSSDLPPIKGAKPAAKHVAQPLSVHQPTDPEASLSSRIPKL